MNLLCIACGWTIFYFLHSLLASNTIKNMAAKKLGNAYKAYRLTYNILNLIFFLVLFYLQNLIKPVILFEPIVALKIIGLLLLLTGSIIGILSFRNYSIKEFVGLQYLKNKNNTNKSLKLNTNGLNQFIRHPLYLATICLLIGYWFIKPQASTTIFVSISLLYIYVGTLLEEKKLVQQFGKQYTNYQLKTPMFFPKLFK
jgi:protein-S-isoprenylcysteine O-methyltransferase Ste14